MEARLGAGGEGVKSLSRARETARKLARLREWMAEQDLPAVVLARAGSLAWLTGITVQIERGAAFELLWAVVTPGGAAIVTSVVEWPRVAAEGDLEALGLALVEVPWQDGDAAVRAAERLAGTPRRQIAGDGHPAFGLDVEVALIGLRLTLSAEEQDRMRALGRDAATVLEEAVRAWRPGERDLDLLARLVGAGEERGILAACAIVGGDERVTRFRHPIAVGAPMERLVMAVVVGMRGGLHVALTRFASAGPVEPAVAAARRGALAVETALLGAVVPGVTHGALMERLAAAYARIGQPDAWREHYQGGPIGYRQREFELAPDQPGSPWWGRVVSAGDAVAFNPSLRGGGKLEDTFLVTAGGLEPVTQTDAWPTESVTLETGQRVERPVILDVTA